MEIVDMYVDEDYRGAGYCKQLINDCINVSNKLNRSLILSVEGANYPAKKCYESNGFKYIYPTDELINFYKIRWGHLKDPLFMYRYIG
jgi:ribosomal protein S18 acetylase RimI-like enzyme